MTSGSPEDRILVLGLGNLLLSDDGVGLRLLERLAAEPLAGVEYIDGGTQGLVLLGLFERRIAVLICDAVGLGAPPGTVHVLGVEQIAEMRGTRAGSAHESNALGILQALTLLGGEPPRMWVVGVEPAAVRTGIGLSATVEAALPEALKRARALLDNLHHVTRGGDARG